MGSLKEILLFKLKVFWLNFTQPFLNIETHAAKSQSRDQQIWFPSHSRLAINVIMLLLAGILTTEGSHCVIIQFQYHLVRQTAQSAIIIDCTFTNVRLHTFTLSIQTRMLTATLGIRLSSVYNINGQPLIAPSDNLRGYSLLCKQ